MLIWWVLIMFYYYGCTIAFKGGGYLYFEFLCFINPDHIDYTGLYCDSLPSKHCDFQLKICISSNEIGGYPGPEKCSLKYMEAGPYDNIDRVCKYPTDNRDVLSRLIYLELGYPLQETYYVSISIIDVDSFTSPSHVALFSTNINMRPAPNLQEVQIQEIPMRRAEKDYRNPKASLVIKAGLQCAKNLFGRYCEVMCQESPSTAYKCAYNGTKVCNEGWIGPNCNIKDLCLYLACAPNSTCLIINNEAKCMCNGEIGPQCYPNYDPCSAIECKNNGSCIPQKYPSQIRTHCQCPYLYYGSDCSQVHDICQISPCLNNGTCNTSIDKISRNCQCTHFYSGDSCQYYNPIDTNHNNSIISSNSTKYVADNLYYKNQQMLALLISIGILLLGVTLILVFVLLRTRKKARSKFDKLPRLTMKELLERNPSRLAPRHNSNMYTCNTTVDGIYTQIDDQEVYDKIESPYEKTKDEQIDDYLIPISPTISKTKSNINDDSTETYLVCELSLPKNNSIVDENPPPLPTRLPSKNEHSPSWFTKLPITNITACLK